MKRNKTKGFQKKEANSAAINAANMVKEVKTGNWRAYAQWLQQCQLANMQEGEFYTTN